MNRQGQHKKINRYFIDQKIPGNVRGKIPLIADGHHILWIIGGRVSESYKVTEETNLVLQLIWEQMEGNNGT
jgi:tRNA(Ile)-lysidine synthase